MFSKSYFMKNKISLFYGEWKIEQQVYIYTSKYLLSFMSSKYLTRKSSHQLWTNLEFPERIKKWQIKQIIWILIFLLITQIKITLIEFLSNNILLFIIIIVYDVKKGSPYKLVRDIEWINMVTRTSLSAIIVLFPSTSI